MVLYASNSKIEVKIFYDNKDTNSFLSYSLSKKQTTMSCSQHTCTSRCCNDDSHNTSPHGGQEITAKEYLKYVATQEQIRNEQRQAAKKVLRLKLKNKRKTRVGQATNQFHLDSSGNTIQVQASRRAFIMEHLAKVQLAKSLGMEDKVPSLKNVLDSYNKPQPTKVQPIHTSECAPPEVFPALGGRRANRGSKKKSKAQKIK